MLWAFSRRREGLVPEMAKNFPWLVVREYVNYCQDKLEAAKRNQDAKTAIVYEQRINALLIHVGKTKRDEEVTNPGIPLSLDKKRV